MHNVSFISKTWCTLKIWPVPSKLGHKGYMYSQLNIGVGMLYRCMVFVEFRESADAGVMLLVALLCLCSLLGILLSTYLFDVSTDKPSKIK